MPNDCKGVRYLPPAISTNGRQFIDAAHFKAAIPVSADPALSRMPISARSGPGPDWQKSTRPGHLLPCPASDRFGETVPLA